MPSHLNVEIKARCDDPKVVLQRLQCLGAVLQGVDRQVDTYFHAATGRLNLDPPPRFLAGSDGVC